MLQTCKFTTERLDPVRHPPPRGRVVARGRGWRTEGRRCHRRPGVTFREPPTAILRLLVRGPKRVPIWSSAPGPDGVPGRGEMVYCIWVQVQQRDGQYEKANRRFPRTDPYASAAAAGIGRIRARAAAGPALPRLRKPGRDQAVRYAVLGVPAPQDQRLGKTLRRARSPSRVSCLKPPALALSRLTTS